MELGRFSTPDYLRHLAIANASLNELESDLHFLDRTQPKRTDADQALALAVQVRRPLWELIKALRNKQAGKA